MTREAPRERGTGSIRQQPSGRFAAWAVTGKPYLGTFDSESEAQAAIDTYAATGQRVQPVTRGRPPTSEAATIAKGIGRYLNDVEAGITGTPVVNLGAVGEGLPSHTSDPADVERAIEIIKVKARTGTAVQRLKRHQRVITLQRELAALRNPVDDSRAFFVKHAREWAEANGVGYSAFRVMGVPVDVLTEAGIARNFEP